MQKFYCVVFIILLITCSCRKQDPKSKNNVSTPKNSFTSTKQFSDWMSGYYLNPQPEKVVASIYFISEKILKDAKLAKNAAAPCLGFFTQIFRHNPQHLENWYQALAKLDLKMRMLIWRSLWFANTPEAKKVLEKQVGKYKGKADKLLQNLLKSSATPILKIPLSPATLDIYWSSFSASGNKKYVIAVIKALPLMLEKNMGKFMVGSAARWSLLANCKQHKKVLAICQQEVKKLSGKPKEQLQKIIARAKKTDNKK